MGLDANDLVKAIRQISHQTDEASLPCDIIFGTVISPEPDIKIQISQKLILEKDDLVLCRDVTDYEIEVESLNWYTEIADNHKHEIKDKKKIKVCNKLKAGEKVIIARKRKGQLYIVLDREVVP